MQTPTYLVGTVLENRLGLQVFRTLGKHFVNSLRPLPQMAVGQEQAAALSRDGVVAIPDFLPPDQFAGLLDELAALRSHLPFRSFRDRQGRMSVARLMLTRHSALAPKFNRYLGTNQLIRELAGFVSRTVKVAPPTLELTCYKMVNGELADNDDENLLHADLHSPTVKCFYYLSDTDERNGAFIYAKGSAKLTTSRLMYEYNLSVSAARVRQGDFNLPRDRLAWRVEQPRPVMTPEERERMGIVETQFAVKANTLLVANNMGFHRRGEFSCDRERVSVVINFRHLQKPFLS